MGEYGDRLDENFGALIKPSASAWEKAKTAVDFAASISGIPGLGIAVKGLCLGRAWLYDEKKPDRVMPILLGLRERIDKVEGSQKEYLKTEEAQAVLEETLGRIADQPDEDRRETMRRVFMKILETPRDPAENKLFVRLVDELPAPALKLLGATHRPVNPLVSTMQGLGQQKEVQNDDAKFWLNYLVGQGLVDAEQVGVVHHGTYESVLTPLGRLFEVYRRG